MKKQLYLPGSLPGLSFIGGSQGGPRVRVRIRRKNYRNIFLFRWKILYLSQQNKQI